MPFEIAIFMSMTVIAVVRILSYYKEDSAQEIAKMIPYAVLSFFLTSAVVFADPHFLSQKIRPGTSDWRAVLLFA